MASKWKTHPSHPQEILSELILTDQVSTSDSDKSCSLLRPSNPRMTECVLSLSQQELFKQAGYGPRVR